MIGQKQRCKKPGRFQVTCSSCQKEFSTHSTNRDRCHSCLPKCRERHFFDDLMAGRTDKSKKDAKTVEIRVPAVTVVNVGKKED